MQSEKLARAVCSLVIGHWSFFGHWSLVIGRWQPHTCRAGNANRSFRECWICALLLWLLFVSAPAVPAQAPRAASAFNHFGQLPLYFEVNQGQADPWVQFVARGRDQGIYLGTDGATIALKQDTSIGNKTRPGPLQSGGGDTVRFIRLSLVGANPHPHLAGMERMGGQVNYFLGNDPARWQKSVPIFAQARYEQVYPGIDLVYYGNDQCLEYDFVVGPGADPSGIALRFDGADRLDLDERGDLVVQAGQRRLCQHQPSVYQTIAGARREIPGRYQLKDRRTVTIAIGHYERSQPLIIDPVLSYSTYFGGNKGDIGWAIAADANGCAYVAGDTLSIFRHLPLSGFQTSYGGGTKYGGDAFVAKLDPTGTNLAYLTYLGGSLIDGAVGIALDNAGCAYITGYTDSTDFPTLGPFGSAQPAIAGTIDPTFKVHFPDAFVTKLDANGLAVYSTYLGGEFSESGSGIAVDTNGCAYVVGYTESALAYYVLNQVCQMVCTNAECVDKGCVTNASVVRVVLTNQLVTNLLVQVTATQPPVTNTIQTINTVTLLGATLVTTGFPTTNAWQNNNRGVANLFLSKLSADGAKLVYSTYLGGSDADLGTGVAVDPSGNACVCGWSVSTNFPVTNAIQHALGGRRDAVVAKFDASGTSLIYATYLGGTRDDLAYRVAVDGAGCAYVTGKEASTDFPSTPGALHPGGIFQSVDGGGTWSLSSTGLTHPNVRTLIGDPVSPTTLYAGTPRGVFKSVDGGLGWSAFNEGLVSPAVNTLAIDPSAPATLYAGTSGGLFKSTNGGSSWAAVNAGLSSTAIRAILFEPGSSTTVFAGTAAGVFKSIDAATNWSAVNSGLRNRSVQGLTAHPSAPMLLYAATDGGVYKSTNSGGQWRSSNTGLSSTHSRAIAIDPSNPQVIYVGTTRGLFKSINAATNWTLFTNGLGRPLINTILIDANLPSTIYAGTTNGLFKSIDAGLSWTPSLTNRGAKDVATIAASSSTMLYAGIRGTNFAGGTNDAFLVKLAADGSSLVYANTFGGNRNDEGWDVAVDATGSAFVVGQTASRNFPVAGGTGAQTNLAGKIDAFIAQFDPTGTSNIFSIFLGGKSADLGQGIALDPAGSVYVVGQTRSGLFPTTNAIQSSFGSGGRDAFVAKLIATPSLMLKSANDQVRVSWSAAATEFILESCDPANGRWMPVAQKPTSSDGRQTVVLPAAATSCYFRLRCR